MATALVSEPPRPRVAVSRSRRSPWNPLTIGTIPRARSDRRRRTSTWATRAAPNSPSALTPASPPRRLRAGTPTAFSAAARKAAERSSPVASARSTSRAAGPAPRPVSRAPSVSRMWSVVCPIALTTATTFRPPETRAATRRAARRIRAERAERRPAELDDEGLAGGAHRAPSGASERRAREASRSVRRSERSSRPTERRTRSGETPAASRSSSVLLVGGRPGMDDEALGVADVRDEGEEPEARDQVPRGLLGGNAGRGFHAEGQDPAKASRERTARRLVRRVGRETRVTDPSDVRVRLEVAGDGEGVLTVAANPEREGLEPLEEEERMERGDGRTDVAQEDDTEASGVRSRRGGRRKGEPVVGRLGVGVELPGARRAAPVESARIDDDASDRVPCPPVHFVAEWRTTSAPWSMGRQRSGVAKVLSTTSGTPAAWATSARAAEVRHVEARGSPHRLDVDRPRRCVDRGGDARGAFGAG